jgi:hypothetical protein
MLEPDERNRRWPILNLCLGIPRYHSDRRINRAKVHPRRKPNFYDSGLSYHRMDSEEAIGLVVFGALVCAVIFLAAVVF